MISYREYLKEANSQIQIMDKWFPGAEGEEGMNAELVIAY